MAVGFKMDLKKEYADIIDSVERHLELLSLSGVTTLPAANAKREPGCSACGLRGKRTGIITGEGSAQAGLMFVGGAPGEDDDASGRPFSGPAGELLTKIINAMGFAREDVYICYALRCGVPDAPGRLDEEIASCRPFLEKEISEVSPRVIVALGEIASTALLGNAPFSGARGRFHAYGGMLIMPTYEPATLLKRPELKRDVWKDMQAVAAKLKKA